jgi:hypothetical protein
MHKLLLAASVLFLSSKAFAIEGCEGVDLKVLEEKMDKIVAEGTFGEERKRFNQEITGRNRLCVNKIHAAKKAGKALTDMEKKIDEYFDVIIGPW